MKSLIVAIATAVCGPLTVGFAVGVSGVMVILPAFAEAGATPSTEGPDKGDEIQEIVVFAQHRQENLQDVPIAIAAFSEAQAKHEGITDALSFASMVPGFNFNRQGAVASPFLRGVGTSIDQAGSESSVAFYIDDVYIASQSGTLANFNNIAALEVEKGPQGTLFGRNATGGVIQVRTKDPTDDPHADVTIGYGNYDTKSASIYATSKLVDTLSANIALYLSKQADGWGRNETTGAAVNTAKDYGGRVKLLWAPTQATSVLLTLDHDTTFTQQGSVFNGVAGQLNGIGGVPGFASKPAPGYYDANANVAPSGSSAQNGVSMKLVQDLGWSTLTNIAAYRSTQTQFAIDEDLGPLALVNVDAREFDSQKTEEVRLASKDGSISWMTGLFYFNDQSGLNPLTIGGDSLAPSGFSSYSIHTTQHTNSYAVFGQATDEIFRDTHLTAGARYTIDERSITSNYDLNLLPDGSVGGVPPNDGASHRWTKPTFRLSLDHRFLPDVLGYVAYNRGYKSGLYNVVVSPGSPIAPPVNPEVLDSYTVGTKTEWLDNRLRVNLEGFYYKYKNIQISTIVSGATLFYNAAAATIKGVDLDVQAVPIKNLTLNASFEVMKGTYTSLENGTLNTYDAATGGNILSSAILEGNRTIQTPPFSASVSASYAIPTQALGSFAANIAYTHFGDYFADPDNGQGQPSSSTDRQSIVNLVNLSTNWTSPDEKWDITVWGKNVTGAKYWVFKSEVAFGTVYSAAAPSTYGLTLTRHFGK